MTESNDRSSLPQFGSIQDLIDYFDTHDLGEALERMPEAHFDVDIQRRTYLVAIDGALLKTLSEIARSQQIPTEALINSWLKEKASAQTR